VLGFQAERVAARIGDAALPDFAVEKIRETAPGSVVQTSRTRPVWAPTRAREGFADVGRAAQDKLWS